MSYIEYGEIIDIDADKRTNLEDRTDDFSFEVKSDTSKGYDRCCVLSATIKKSWYLVQQGENTFVLTEDGASQTVTIPVGNYSATSFMNVVPPLLNLASSGNGKNWTYTMSLPNLLTEAGTAKYTFGVSGNGGKQPSFTFSNALTYQFGFNAVRSPERPTVTATFTDNQLVSANCIDFQLDDAIFIDSDMCLGDGRTSRFQSIISTSEDYSVIRYQCLDIQANSKHLNTGKNVYNYRLTNHDRKPILLNGVNWLMQVFVYKKRLIDK